jgi:hypothetical protein
LSLLLNKKLTEQIDFYVKTSVLACKCGGLLTSFAFFLWVMGLKLYQNSLDKLPQNSTVLHFSSRCYRKMPSNKCLVFFLRHTTHTLKYSPIECNNSKILCSRLGTKCIEHRTKGVKSDANLTQARFSLSCPAFTFNAGERMRKSKHTSHHIMQPSAAHMFAFVAPRSSISRASKHNCLWKS